MKLFGLAIIWLGMLIMVRFLCHKFLGWSFGSTVNEVIAVVCYTIYLSNYVEYKNKD